MKKSLLRWASLAAAALMLALAVGCSTLGVPSPSKPGEKAVAALNAATQANTQAELLLTAGKISPRAASNVRARAHEVAVTAQIARGLMVTDPVAGQAKLDQAVLLLTALQAYLADAERGAK